MQLRSAYNYELTAPARPFAPRPGVSAISGLGREDRLQAFDLLK